MTSFHSPSHSIHTPTQNLPGALGVPRGDPPNDPPGNDPDADFDSPNTSDTDPVVIFTNLAKAIKSLAKSSGCNPSETLQHIKVWELDQFDGTDSVILGLGWGASIASEVNGSRYEEGLLLIELRGSHTRDFLGKDQGFENTF